MAVYTPETNKTKRIRTVMSFLLFAVLVLFSISLNLKTNAFDYDLIEKELMDYDYISGIRDDAYNYAIDLYKLNGVSEEGLDEALKYRDFEQTMDAYFGFNITSRANYSEDSYLEYIDIITNSFEEDLVTQLDKQSKAYTEKQIELICGKFKDHLTEKVTVDHLSDIKSVANVGSAVANVSLSISIFMIALFIVIMYALGNKYRRYRSIRTIAISFMTAGIYNVLLSIMAYIVFAIKSIDIYPVYLQHQLMRYIYHFFNTVAITGGAFVFISLLLLTLTWKIRKGK